MANKLIPFFLLVMFYHMAAELGHINYNDLCEPTDCSQEATVHRKFFPCKIGKRKDWKAFKNSHNLTIKIRSDYNSENAPIIKKIKLDTFTEVIDNRHVQDPTIRNPYLNVSILVPKGQNVLAVVMKMSSVEDEKFQDEFYFDKPSLRLFNFASYRWLPDEPPLQLHYGCLKGLDDRSNLPMVYRLTLSSLSIGQPKAQASTTYHITAYTHLYKIHKFASTIATSLNPGTNDVRVVFEPLPDVWVKDNSDASYHLSLYDNNSNEVIDTTRVFHSSGDYRCTLHNRLHRRSVYVKLVIQGYKDLERRIQIASSYPIQTNFIAVSSAKSTSFEHESETQDKKYPYIFLGSLLGAVLIISLLVLYGRKYTDTDFIFVKCCDEEWWAILNLQKILAKNLGVKSQILNVDKEEFKKILLKESKTIPCSRCLTNRAPAYIVVCRSSDDFTMGENNISQITSEKRIAFLSVERISMRSDYVEHLSRLIKEVLKLNNSRDFTITELQNKVKKAKHSRIHKLNPELDSICFSFEIYGQTDNMVSLLNNDRRHDDHDDHNESHQCSIHKLKGDDFPKNELKDSDSIILQMEKINFYDNEFTRV